MNRLRRPGSTRNPVIPILMVLLIAGAIAISGPWRRAREEARRTQCAGQLHAIGHALRYYHHIHGAYPPLSTADGDEVVPVSWRVLILAAWHQDDSFSQYRASEPWDSDHNSRLISHRYAEAFVCPSVAEASRRGTTSYLAIVGDGTVWNEVNLGHIHKIDDEIGKMIVVIEVPESDIVWTEPRDISPAEAISLFRSHDGFKESRNGGPLHYLTAAGKVHRFDELSGAHEFARLLTAAR